MLEQDQRELIEGASGGDNTPKVKSRANAQAGILRRRNPGVSSRGGGNMTKILEQLKQAEAQRQRVVAERKQLEDEANAALAAYEREERARRAAAATPPLDPASRAEAGRDAARQPLQGKRVLAGVAVLIAAALIAVFWGIPFAPQEDAQTYRGAATLPEAGALVEARGDPLRLKLDRNLGAFAARVREKEKR